MEQAKFIKAVILDGVNTGKLYNLSKPLKDREGVSYEYVILTAFIAPGYFGEPMTLILPSNEDGDILSWHELEGSQLGVLSYTTVLNALGYVEV